MSRLLGVACVVTLLVGCAQALSAPRAPETCGRGGAPPAPLVDAALEDDRIRVHYRVARPARCAADAIVITASSVRKADNVAPSPTNGLIRLTGSEGTVELELPPLDLPPYEVRAAALTPKGERSVTTVVRLPSSSDDCRGESCLRRAEEKLERCIRGLAAREACPAYVWRTRPPIPYEPVQGVTRAALERSFTALVGSPVACLSTSECVVGEVTFAVSGYRQRPGCWIAEHRLDRYRACVDWKWSA